MGPNFIQNSWSFFLGVNFMHLNFVLLKPLLLRGKWESQAARESHQGRGFTTLAVSVINVCSSVNTHTDFYENSRYSLSGRSKNASKFPEGCAKSPPLAWHHWRPSNHDILDFVFKKNVSPSWLNNVPGSDNFVTYTFLTVLEFFNINKHVNFTFTPGKNSSAPSFTILFFRPMWCFPRQIIEKVYNNTICKQWVF